MSKFGWSLPPGCGTLPGEEPTPPCECCGGDPEWDNDGPGACICPECPACAEIGDPKCYQEGHLTYTQAQLDGQARLAEEYRQQAEADKAEAEYWASQPAEEWPEMP